MAALAVLVTLLLLSAAPKDDRTFHITRLPWQAGEHFEISSVADAKLEAEIGAGFLSQHMSYDFREEELLQVQVLPPGDDGTPRMTLAFPVRRGTTIAPLIGRKVKQRRVAGKSYRVESRADGLAVLDDDDNAVREKEARHVRASFAVLGAVPPLFAMLPKDGELHAGQELGAEGALARNILGLPIEELEADSLRLRVVDLDEQGDLVCEASTQLGGEKEVAGRDVTLRVELSGPFVIDLATGRMRRMELSGTATIVADSDDDLLKAHGEGTLTLRRMMRALED